MKAKLAKCQALFKELYLYESLDLTTILQGNYNSFLHPHFINEETEEKKLKELAQGHEQLNGGASIWI